MILRVLEAGDRVEGFGSVVRLVDGFGLKHEDDEIDGFPQPVYAPGGAVVRIHHLDDGDALLGRRFAVMGRWSGSALEVDQMDERPLPTLSTPFWTWRAPPDFPRLIPIDGLDPAAIERAWNPLWEDCILLSRAVDGHGVAHVVTHDLDRAEAALRPVYGDRLVLSASPWPPEVFRRIEALTNVAEQENVLFVMGGGFGCDLAYDGYIGIAYVTDAIAALAREIPEGALRIDTLLRPVVAATR